MAIRTLILDVYISPESNMTLDEFDKHREQVHRIWGDSCNFDIRWRFQDNQRPIMKRLEGPFVPPGLVPPELIPFVPNVLNCGFYDDIPDNFQNPGSDPFYTKQWLAYRPGMDGSPFGQTNAKDIAVYYVRGPLLRDGNLGCGGYVTPNGPAIVITNHQTSTPETIFFTPEQILAHELGHVLLQHDPTLPNGGHVNDVNNIMYVNALQPSSRNVTIDQCNIARTSPYFQDFL